MNNFKNKKLSSIYCQVIIETSRNPVSFFKADSISLRGMQALSFSQSKHGQILVHFKYPTRHYPKQNNCNNIVARICSKHHFVLSLHSSVEYNLVLATCCVELFYKNWENKAIDIFSFLVQYLQNTNVAY